MSPEIVVDVGCHNHGVDTTAVLIERFNPDAYYGFDPLAVDAVYTTGQTAVEISHKAAWLYNGQVGFQTNGDASMIDGLESTSAVPCFDFGEWLEPLLDGNVILKLDCEGAEWRLIDTMRLRDQLERLQLLLIEWHLPCEVEEWPL